MTESRVEAVAAPIERALRSAGMSEDLIKIVRVSTAELAIAANDAWFQTHGWKAVPREHPRGEATFVRSCPIP